MGRVVALSIEVTPDLERLLSEYSSAGVLRPVPSSAPFDLAAHNVARALADLHRRARRAACTHPFDHRAGQWCGVCGKYCGKEGPHV